MTEERMSREELAALEVGQTTIARPLSILMCIGFVLFIFSIPLFQETFDRGTDGRDTIVQKIINVFSYQSMVDNQENSEFISRVNVINESLLSGMATFEEKIEDESFLRDLIQEPGQRALLSIFHHGNEKVYPGKDDWLFYAPDMEYLIGPGFLSSQWQAMRGSTSSSTEPLVQPDPIAGIVSFRNRLREHGVELLIVPTPIKGSLHPEKFSSRAGSIKKPLQNRSWITFLVQLEKEKLNVFDPAPLLLAYAEQANKPSFLMTDTHWSPEAMSVVAEKMSHYVQDQFDFAEDNLGLQRTELPIQNNGDIEVMLKFSEGESLYGKEEVTIQQVTTSADEFWRSSKSSDILLLGDSFSNIYSLGGMDWGEGAGFAEQLSFYLDREIDTILQNDGGSFATREFLSRQLSRGDDRLAGKKLVIWQFATRELSHGNWQDFPLEYKEKAVSDFFIAEGDKEITVRGEIIALSRSQRPGSVPYKDNVVTLHLGNIVDVETGAEYGEALVYLWGMKDNVLTSVATKRNGDMVTLKLIDWEDVEGEFSSYRRSTLDDELVEYELPNWGEFVQ